MCVFGVYVVVVCVCCVVVEVEVVLVLCELGWLVKMLDVVCVMLEVYGDCVNVVYVCYLVICWLLLFGCFDEVE